MIHTSLLSSLNAHLAYSLRYYKNLFSDKNTDICLENFASCDLMDCFRCQKEITWFDFLRRRIYVFVSAARRLENALSGDHYCRDSKGTTIQIHPFSIVGA